MEPNRNVSCLSSLGSSFINKLKKYDKFYVFTKDNNQNNRPFRYLVKYISHNDRLLELYDYKIKDYIMISIDNILKIIPCGDLK